MSDSPDNNGPPGVGSTVTAWQSDPRWQAAEQIASSPHFRRSPRLKELWLYIARNSVTGRADQLTESEIARQVFGRGLDYVPTEDSIVRSSARQLRWKLKEAIEEIHTPWSIEIPKGRYVAQFHLRESGLIETPVEPDQGTEKPVPPPSRRGLLLMILVATLAVSLVVNVWLGIASGRSSFTQHLGLVADLVKTHTSETNVILDDYAYVLMAPRPLLANENLLNNYTTRAYIPSSAAPSKDPELLRLWDLLGTRYIVSLGAVATEDRIIRSLRQQDQDRVVLRHARNVVARDFQRGNHILFGSTPNNPWTALFEDQLNFRFARRASGAAMFVNISPGHGEPAQYDISQAASVNSGPGYARIVYLPNLTHTGFILLVTGLNMVTAEAAGEFASNAVNVPTLFHLFGVERVEDLPYFEVLLRTSAIDNMPKTASVAAYRRITKP